MLKSNQSKLRWVGVIVLGIMFMGLQGFCRRWCKGGTKPDGCTG